MKILFLHPNEPDYLAESLFHGLRELLGDDVVDVPRYDSMYKDLPASIRSKFRGGGFTLYGLLNDLPELSGERYNWKQDLNNYDLIIFSNIYDQWSLFNETSKFVPVKKLVILDGADSPAVYPFLSLKQRIKNNFFSLFIPLRNIKYFKREFIKEQMLWKGSEKYIPHAIIRAIAETRIIYPITFSIPEEKIIKTYKTLKKDKIFPDHIVDHEVSEKIKGSFFSKVGSDKHLFKDESCYYNDLQHSKFGITTKRAGWDCLRHYELAANGCVLSFKDLDLKPAECAPLGLNEKNCISYKNYDDLIQKISNLSENDYGIIQENSMKWINTQTTKNVAQKFLEYCKHS